MAPAARSTGSTAAPARHDEGCARAYAHAGLCAARAGVPGAVDLCRQSHPPHARSCDPISADRHGALSRRPVRAQPPVQGP